MKQNVARNTNTCFFLFKETVKFVLYGIPYSTTNWQLLFAFCYPFTAYCYLRMSNRALRVAKRHLGYGNILTRLYASKLFLFSVVLIWNF